MLKMKKKGALHVLPFCLFLIKQNGPLTPTDMKKESPLRRPKAGRFTGNPGGSRVLVCNPPLRPARPVPADPDRQATFDILASISRMLETLTIPVNDDPEWIEAGEAGETFNLPPVMISLLADSWEISSRIIGGNVYFLYHDIELYLEVHKPLCKGGDA